MFGTINFLRIVTNSPEALDFNGVFPIVGYAMTCVQEFLISVLGSSTRLHTQIVE